jgi:hypothetical protein
VNFVFRIAGEGVQGPAHFLTPGKNRAVHGDLRMTKKYQSEQLMVCHQDAEALYRIGAINDAEMRKFDEDCLVSEPKTPKKAHVDIRQSPIAAYTLPRKA